MDTEETSEISPEEYEKSFKHISEMAKAIAGLYDTAYATYKNLVNLVLQDAITDVGKIEHIMDGLLDYCADERFVEMYKKICRHIYDEHPQLVNEHVEIFRELYDSEEQPE